MTPLIIIAGLGAIALVVSKVVQRFVPEIVVFLALGVLIGPEGPLPLINEANIRSLNLVTIVALGAIIFLLGDRLRFDSMRQQLGLLLPLNLLQLVAAGALVFVGSRLAGASVGVSLVLGLIAAETGVLTVTATVKEERAKGEFTDLLLAGVGVTNVAVAILFGVAFPFVLAAGVAATPLTAVTAFAQIVVASTVIGFAGGWVLTRFGARIETSGELLLFLLITLISVAGLDLLVDGSVVISTLIAGVYVVNLAPWLADRFFAAVRSLEAPIYLIFFVVAGASIHFDDLQTVGLLGVIYVAARTVGKVGGAMVGGWLSRPRMRPATSWAIGYGTLPHAGMAIALVAFVVEQAPALGDEVSAVVLGSILVFELGGPLLTRRALRASGERRQQSLGPGEDLLPDLATTRTFRRVLIPVGSLRVLLPRLPFLLDLVGNLNAEFVAVHVSLPGSSQDELKVLALVRRVAEERNIPVRTLHLVNERVADALVRAAHDEDVDIIVMGQPVRGSPLERSHSQLIVRRVMQMVDVPVLVYPVDPANPRDVPSVYLRRATDAEDADADAGSRPAQEPATRRDPDTEV
ncbi:MAG: cation:proton antiporter [Egibacteraceae bacterium]